MHRGGDALTVTVGAGRVGRRRPMEEAILRVVVEVVEMVELTAADVRRWRRFDCLRRCCQCQ